MKPDDGIVSSSLQPVRPIPMMKTNVNRPRKKRRQVSTPIIEAEREKERKIRIVKKNQKNI